ncbi:hypothetical protein [Caldisericum sp.]|uniref:hypothetical protein n=1 Tax=Caldisericum sp. TaxID=2499687 RepID=UPI003D113F1E
MEKKEKKEVFQVDLPKKEENQEKTKEVVFKSYHRGTIVFIEPEKYIKFLNHIYKTSDEKIINFLRSHPAFGVEIFENEFPDFIIKQIEENKKYISSFNPEEEKIIA